MDETCSYCLTNPGINELEVTAVLARDQETSPKSSGQELRVRLVRVYQCQACRADIALLDKTIGNPGGYGCFVWLLAVVPLMLGGLFFGQAVGKESGFGWGLLAGAALSLVVMALVTRRVRASRLKSFDRARLNFPQRQLNSLEQLPALIVAEREGWSLQGAPPSGALAEFYEEQFPDRKIVL